MSAPRAARHLAESYEAVVTAVLFALFFRTFVFQMFEIPSGSMEDNLLIGDHILVNKFVYGPHRGPWARLLPHRDVGNGDVIVFRYPEDPERDFIKRVMGRPGDEVRIQDKVVFRDGRRLDETYTVHRDPEVFSRAMDVPDSVRRRDDFGPFRVPRDGFFVMGDNRDNSQDSRFWGVVPKSHLRGRALAVYWSYDAAATPRRFTGRAAGLRSLLDTALHFFTRTRWGRSFRLVR
jgi:signal peptidase I